MTPVGFTNQEPNRISESYVVMNTSQCAPVRILPTSSASFKARFMQAPALMNPAVPTAWRFELLADTHAGLRCNGSGSAVLIGGMHEARGPMCVVRERLPVTPPFLGSVRLPARALSAPALTSPFSRPFFPVSHFKCVNASAGRIFARVTCTGLGRRPRLSTRQQASGPIVVWQGTPALRHLLSRSCENEWPTKLIVAGHLTVRHRPPHARHF